VPKMSYEITGITIREVERGSRWFILTTDDPVSAERWLSTEQVQNLARALTQ